MKTSAPALLPILRSAAVGELLARLYLDPTRRWTLSELARQARVSVATATREVDRLVAAGLAHDERVGRTRLVRANETARIFEPLRQLVSLTYGPVPVLEDELRRVAGIEQAFVYGSWAARHAGRQGPEPNDVDVLAVGNPDPDELFAAGERARSRLHREVNIRAVAPATWAAAEPSDPFLRHVQASPLVALDLGGDV